MLRWYNTYTCWYDQNDYRLRNVFDIFHFLVQHAKYDARILAYLHTFDKPAQHYRVWIQELDVHRN